ncbi:hypothetical protein [Plantibacter sp. CFBP 8804]|uniref:hypothetical protein n=1 Tax=Plantibacter sp. CFBP 8804 TaxID=2775270 RepID=UPI00178663C4|nr:hypothetical protein [Plantibacter sp. CFBP 8804]MBD8519145.1 hypothetical protein [Plantibacter sp. CFBP 8804]
MCAAPVPVLLSTHPGSGVSSLAAATGFYDGFQPWHAGHEARVLRLLVGRTHVAGLKFVRDALSAKQPGTTLVLLVPDAPGKLPKPLRDQVDIISGVTPVTLAPWVESWRWEPGIELPKPVTVFRTALHAALTEQLLTTS